VGFQVDEVSAAASREFLPFVYKDARFRISREGLDAATLAIRTGRKALERYILLNPAFKDSLVPVQDIPDPDASSDPDPGPSARDGFPPLVLAMHRASLATGVGPMAAVAGTFAELAGRAALASGAGESIVENGGDIFMKLVTPLVMGLYAGASRLSGKLAFRIDPDRTPLGVCSSSGTMGHSLSLGKCDLATVFSADTALADAAATLAANLVSTEADIQPALERVGAIPGILGILIIKGDKLGMTGELPPLIKHQDPQFTGKITKDPRSGWVF
jgi:ApbE superfamily uncharacterized protein (UPF0280 family)